MGKWLTEKKEKEMKSGEKSGKIYIRMGLINKKTKEEEAKELRSKLKSEGGKEKESMTKKKRFARCKRMGGDGFWHMKWVKGGECLECSSGGR